MQAYPVYTGVVLDPRLDRGERNIIIITELGLAMGKFKKEATASFLNFYWT